MNPFEVQLDPDWGMKGGYWTGVTQYGAQELTFDALLEAPRNIENEEVSVGWQIKSADATEELWTDTNNRIKHTVTTKDGLVKAAASSDWIGTAMKTTGNQLAWGGSRPYLTAQKDLIQLKLGLTPELSFHFSTDEKTG